MSMTDEEWKKRRSRALMATFQTGRAVFADTDGELRYADGDREPLVDAAAKPSWRTRIKRWLGRSSP